MCDCAEELERRERAKAQELENALAGMRASGRGLFSRLYGFIAGAGAGGGAWLPVIGGAAVLVGLLRFIYKNIGGTFKMTNFIKSNIVDRCKGKGAGSAATKTIPPPKATSKCDCD